MDDVLGVIEMDRGTKFMRVDVATWKRVRVNRCNVIMLPGTTQCYSTMYIVLLRL
jgi:hypothetical protein